MCVCVCVRVCTGKTALHWAASMNIVGIMRILQTRSQQGGPRQPGEAKNAALYTTKYVVSASLNVFIVALMGFHVMFCVLAAEWV